MGKTLILGVEQAKLDEFGGWLNSSLKAVKKKRQALLDTQDARERGFQESTSPSWIFDQKKFKDWLSAEQSCVLWIYGTTGLGKSVLSAYLSKELPARAPSYLTAFFFCSKDNVILQDETQLLLTFLGQIIVKSPDAREVVRKIWGKNPSIADSTASLGQYIEGLLAPALESFARTSSQQILFLIDGLNECPDKSVQGIVRLIRRLTAFPQSENGGETSVMPVVKILLTCQETAEISRDLTNATKAGIYGQNLGNIETYVTQMLELHSEIAANFKAINIDAIEYFTEKSSGMFLWVSSMLECIRLTPLNDLERMLKHAPRDVELIYRDTLIRTTAKLHDFEIEHVAEVLQWLCTATRDLTFMELQLGLALARDPESDPSPNMAAFSESVELALRRCGMFVQIAASESTFTGLDTISLAHATFKQFITNEDLAPANLWVDLSKTSYKVAATCINYLCTMPAFDFSNSPVGTGNEAEATWLDNHQFFLYATSWPDHLKRSRSGNAARESKLVAEALENFLKPAPLKNLITGVLIYTFHADQVWTTLGRVERGITAILDWLDYHGIVLQPDTKVGSAKLFALEETREERSFRSVNSSLLCDLAAHVTAEIWMTGNPKYHITSRVMSLMTHILNAWHTSGIQTFGTVFESEVFDVVSLSNLAATDSELKQSWWEANIGHAHYCMAVNSTTREKRLSQLRQAIERYIVSLDLMTDGDSRNVAQRVWCSLCDCMRMMSLNEGTGLDRQTLQHYNKKVNGLIEAADGISIDTDMIECLDAVDVDMAEYLHSTASLAHTKFVEESSIIDLEEAIALSGFLASKDLDCGRFEKYEYTRMYAWCLVRRFEITRNPGDLETALEVAHRCLRTANTAVLRVDINGLLSVLFNYRFSHITRDLEDIDQAMNLAETAVRDAGDWSAAVAAYGRNLLALALATKYRAVGTKEMIERAIGEMQNSLATKDLPFQEVVFYEVNFIDHSVDQMEEMGEYHDLTRCLDLGQHAMAGTLRGSYLWGRRCGFLAAVYSLVYKKTQCYDSLKQAYESLRDIPSGSKDFSRVLRTISDIALLKYDHTDCVHCLDEAVKFASDALSQITQKPHHKAETADYLLVMAESYRRRFEKYRATDDWKQAVTYSNQAQDANDRKWREGDFEWLCGAVKLSKASDPLELPGIEDAIQTLRKAVEMLSGRGAPARVRGFHQLSLALRKKYEVAGQLADLEESKQWASQAVEIMPQPHITCGVVANNLSRIHLLHAQSANGDISDFVEAAKLSCVNIINTPHDNVAHLEYFKTLNEIFEEGGKHGQDVVEQLQLAADQGKISPDLTDCTSLQ